MRHTLRMHGVIVGHSELEHTDPTLGRAYGALRPGLGYDLVQPVFRLFAQAVPRNGEPRNEELLQRYYKSRDALKLELQDAEGRPIHTSVIHIVDYTNDKGGGALELDVLIKDDDYWNGRAAGA